MISGVNHKCDKHCICIFGVYTQLYFVTSCNKTKFQRQIALKFDPVQIEKPILQKVYLEYKLYLINQYN